MNNFGRQKIAILATVLVILVFAGYSNRASLVEALLKVALPQQLGANRVAALEDGLHVALCGAGGPFPAPRASGPCVAVVAGDQLFIVDTGTDGARNLGRMGYPASQVAAVFLTHFHSDHIDGLGELATARWATSDHTLPLPVYGPEGGSGTHDDDEMRDITRFSSLIGAKEWMHQCGHQRDDQFPQPSLFRSAHILPPCSRLLETCKWIRTRRAVRPILSCVNCRALGADQSR